MRRGESEEAERGIHFQEEREKQVTTIVQEKLGQTQYALTNDIL